MNGNRKVEYKFSKKSVKLVEKNTSQTFLQGNAFFQRPCYVISFLLLHLKRIIAVFKPLLTLISVEECFGEFFDVSKMIFFISPD